MNLIEKINAFINSMSGDAGKIIGVCASVLFFTLVYFFLMKFLCDNNSSKVIPIIALVVFGLGIVFLFSDGISNGIFVAVPSLIAIFIFCLYSTELKRGIWSKHGGKLSDVKTEGGVIDEEKVENCISEIIKAVQDMSKNDVGAIIVLSNGNIPSQILDSGVTLESDISSELIESVFFPKTPLHDGAMIINGTKIVAAGCFLPLSQNINNIPKDLGTRHRAGIGVTETVDVVALIVSEETGIISVARAGKISRYADTNTLRKLLNKYYWQELTLK